MKKQINPTIKAHLIRGAFYLLLLVAVCAIPFALAQSRSRGTTKQGVASKFAVVPAASGAAQATRLSGVHPKAASQFNVASQSKAASQSKTGSQLLPYDVRGVPDLPRISERPQKVSGARAAHVIPIPRPPKAPQVVLYDQDHNASTTATLAATFTDFPTFNADLADDFVVPGGQTWNVQSLDADGVYFNGVGPATDWNVFIYADNAGLPGAQVYSTLNQPVSVSGTTFTVNLSPAAVLSAGTYWIEIQANMTFATQGEWGWTDRTVQSNSPAAWQNPGGGFGICLTWTNKLTCIPTAGGPDQVYRINGTSGGGGTPTPTPSPSPTCTPIVVTGSIDTGDPTQTDRLFRSGVPQTCPASTSCATFGDGLPRHYDSYTFTNTTGATQCVTIDTNTACTGTNFIFIGAYLGSFDPANICTNWIGDAGSSPNPDQPFQVDVDNGQTLVVVVSEVTPDAGCPGYTVTITGLCGGGGGTPTPTATATPSCTAGGTPGPWIAGNPYPTTIVRYGFAQTATDFYVFGGVSDGTQVNAVNSYNIATGTWTPRAPMPFTSEAPTCALMESTGIVYCAQGDTGNGFASYNIATDTWTPLAADPFVTDHYGSVSGAFNGKVFVVGGTLAFSNAVWVYDVASNTWSLGTSAPTGVFELAGYQEVGQFLYVVGGFDPTFVNLATTLRLDMSSGTWDTGPTFTPQLADFGLAYDAGTNKLYSLGGDLGNDGNPFNSTNQVNELDVSAWPAGTWVTSPPNLPSPNRQANQAGFFGNGDIWSVGGIDGATFQFLSEVWHRNDGGCGGASPTPTGTPSATPTATGHHRRRQQERHRPRRPAQRGAHLGRGRRRLRWGLITTAGSWTAMAPLRMRVGVTPSRLEIISTSSASSIRWPTRGRLLRLCPI